MRLLPLLLLAGRAWGAAGLLDYPDAPFKSELVPVQSSADYVEYELRYPSLMKSPWPANDTVWGHFSVPRGKGPFPCVLVLPVMAAPNIFIEQRFINRFRRDQFAVLWLEMPTQFHRRPSPLIPSGQVFLARTAKRLALNFRQSVLDARRALAWLSRRPEVDKSRLALFGISLGSIVASAVYSVDPRPSYAVFLLGGADLPDLVVTSSETGPFVRKAGIKADELRAAWKGLDALDYAAHNAGKPALLINARSDTVIPRPNALKLHEAFPASRQVWLPLGHYTSMLHLIWIPGYVSRDLKAHMVKS